MLNIIISYLMNPNSAFNLNVDYAHSLTCYQCNSSSQENIPLCQIGYFELNKPEQKLNFSLQCPPHIADYCFLFEENLDGMIKTSRGCYGLQDKNNRDVKTGCMVKEKKLLCFCQQKLCNSSQTLLLLNYLLITFSHLFIIII